MGGEKFKHRREINPSIFMNERTFNLAYKTDVNVCHDNDMHKLHVYVDLTLKDNGLVHIY